MSDLVEFFKARRDEDQWIAEGAAQDAGSAWESAKTFGPHGSDPIDDHIARHDPARVLADVQADRRLIAEYERAVEFYNRPENQRHSAGEVTGLYTAIKIRAERFADHPDYRDEWRP
ncbi:DUF6221 family protein [Spirillospora sp. NPDC048911]|uniref:DUF6221 family protein n=1 Tax=Spirillospora sp. NPDC048911 TaxID=3364527 RepID=UPI0037246B89